MISLAELSILVFVFASGGYGVPLGIAPGVEDIYLHQVAPADCVMYSSWSSTVALDPDDNPTEKHLAQPEIQAFLLKMKLELDRIGGDFAKKDDKFRAYRTLVMKLPELALTNAGCFYVDEIKWADDRWIPKMSGAFVFQLGDRLAEFEKLVDEMEDVPRYERDDRFSGSSNLLADSTWDLAPNRIVEIVDEHLVVAFAGDGMELTAGKVAENAKTGEPKWLVEIKAELPVARRSSISMFHFPAWQKFLDVPNNSDLRKPFERLGIKEIQNIGWVTGLNKNGYVCRTSIQCTQKPTGFLQVFDLTPLQQEQLKGIHEDRDFVFASKFSTERLYELIADLATELGEGENFDGAIGDFEAFSGISLRDDLINDLDEYFYVYGDFNFDFTGNTAFGIGIRDEMSFAGTLESFNKRIAQVVDESETVGMHVEQYEGIEIRTATNSRFAGWVLVQSIAWAHVDSQLLIGFDQRAIKRHIDQLKQEGPFFQSTKGKRLFEVADEIDAEGPLAVMSIDLDKLFQMLDPFLQFADDDDPILPEFELTWKDFPSTQILRKGLTPDLTGLYRTENGFQFYQQQVHPGGSPVATYAFAGILAFVVDEIELK